MKTTITPTADAVKPIKPELEDGPASKTKLILPLQKSLDGKRILDNTESLVADCEIRGSNFVVDYSRVDEIVRAVNEHTALVAENAKLRAAVKAQSDVLQSMMAHYPASFSERALDALQLAHAALNITTTQRL